MFRWILLLLSCASLLLGLLTVFRSPDWFEWRLALLAGEFGYYLAVIPLAAVAGAWLRRDGHPIMTAVTLGAGVFAATLLVKPVAEAWWLARTLPQKLERSLGHAEIARGPFSFGSLFRGRPEPVSAQTMNYAGGLMLDFYPAVGRDRAPVVLLVHGGGWDSGRRDEIAHFNHWLARRGYAVAAIDYRLAPKFTWPAQREDISAAIAFLKARAEKLGIDATRIVVMGRSAGGHLAEATAYAANDPAVRGLIALYSPADMHFAWAYAREDDVLKSPLLLRHLLGGTPETARANYDSASPILRVGKNTPPTLLVHGRLDTLVWYRQSERLEQKLSEAGVAHAFVSLPWATHAFEFNLNGPGGQLATYAIEWFLASVTRDHPPPVPLGPLSSNG